MTESGRSAPDEGGSDFRAEFKRMRAQFQVRHAVMTFGWLAVTSVPMVLVIHEGNTLIGVFVVCVLSAVGGYMLHSKLRRQYRCPCCQVVLWPSIFLPKRCPKCKARLSD
jgi:hypothetical protein